MDCARFDRWLDAGRPGEERSEALAHAGVCPACADSLAAARELDVLLRQRFTSAPDGFTDRVMARLPARTPVRSGSGIVETDPAGAWWVRVFQEPLTVASFLTGSLFLVFGARLWRVGEAFLSDTAGRIDAVTAPVANTVLGRLPGPQWLPYGVLLVLSAILAWLLYRMLVPRDGFRAALR